MKKISLALLALAAATALTTSAAAETFSFSIATSGNVIFSPGYSTTNNLTGTEIGTSGNYTITDAIASVSGLNSEIHGTTTGIGIWTGAPAGNNILYESNPAQPLDPTGLTGLYLTFGSKVLYIAYDATLDALFPANANPHFDIIEEGTINNLGAFVVDSSYTTQFGFFSTEDTTSHPLNSVTPEPGSLMLMGSGLLGMAFLLFRTKSSAISQN